MQAANALKNKRLRDKQKKVPFTVPDLSKVIIWYNELVIEIYLTKAKPIK